MKKQHLIAGIATASALVFLYIRQNRILDQIDSLGDLVLDVVQHLEQEAFDEAFEQIAEKLEDEGLGEIDGN